MYYVSMFKIIKKADIILFAALLLLGAALSVPAFLVRGTGDMVRITVGGQLFGTYDLSEDRKITVEEKGCFNRIVIKGGKVWMEKANCKNQVCVNTGRISEAGGSIVCLPNKVAVTVEREGGGKYDAVSGK